MNHAKQYLFLHLPFHKQKDDVTGNNGSSKAVYHPTPSVFSEGEDACIKQDLPPTSRPFLFSVAEDKPTTYDHAKTASPLLFHEPSRHQRNTSIMQDCHLLSVALFHLCFQEKKMPGKYMSQTRHHLILLLINYFFMSKG